MNILPTEVFIKVNSDEGESISGFSAHSIYNDCHHPTYTGILVADFSRGYPLGQIVYDFDIRDKKDGLHVKRDDQIETLGLEEGIEQIRLAKKNVTERMKKTNGIAYCLLDEYINGLAHLERSLTNRNLKNFSRILDSFGNTYSRRFAGYQPEKNSRGWHDAPLYPETMSLKAGETSTVVDRCEFAIAYNTLKRTDYEFWSVSHLPLGEIVQLG